MANIDRPDFDELRDRPGFVARRARIGQQLATERLGVSLWELPAGEAAYPYHFHLAEEELLVVLAGEPALRTPRGWTTLGPGDVVSFPVGTAGAHQVVNRSGETVRFLAVSTHGQPDIVMYPDEGKIGVFERRPAGGGLRRLFRAGDEVDYWAGVEPPAAGGEG